MPFKLENRKEEIIELYLSGMSFYQIAKNIGEYEQAVSNIVRSVIEIPKKKPLSINESYFETIDSVDKAYFFGLIAADGAIVENKNKTKTMTISLTVEDKYILEHLKIVTEAEAIVREYNGSYIRDDGSIFRHARFVSANQEFVRHLVEHGVVQRKSKTLGPLLNEVHPDYRIDFVRGYFDGNGSISKTITSGITPRYYCGFTGTEEILTDIKSFLGINSPKIYWGKGTAEGTGQYSWRFGAKKDVSTFRDLIYHNEVGSCFLTRKKEKFPW